MSILRHKINLICVTFLSAVIVLSGCSSPSTTIAPEEYSVPLQQNEDSTSSTNTTKSTVESTTQSTSTDSATTIDYVFSAEGQQPDQLIINLINKAQSTLDIAIYNLSRESIVQALKDAQKRGVQVHILTDKTKVEKKSQIKLLQTLVEAGATIKINTFDGKMHEKMLIVDRQIATVGSFNYTDESSEENDEVLVAIHDANLAEKWSVIFEHMWNDDSRYETWIANN